MEDLEKYIFDPANPRKCKVYHLLLHIMKKERAFLMSPEFFFEIYNDDYQLKEKLWDIPENYDELSSLKKALVYIDQYSEKEFIAELEEQKVTYTTINTLFQKNLYLKIEKRPFLITNGEASIESQAHFTAQSISDLLLLTKISKNYNIALSPYLQSTHCIFFSDHYLNGIINQIYPKLSSILIATVDDYNELNTTPDNTHPLLLKKRKHIHLLLDVLSRDIQKEEEGAPTTSEQSSVEYLQSIDIKNYFCLKDLSIKDLSNQKEIYFMGENGMGKTLLLQAIILAYKGLESGKVRDYIAPCIHTMKLVGVDSLGKTYSYKADSKLEEPLKNIYAYGVSRNQNDSDRKEKFGYVTLFDSMQFLNNPIKWLQYLDYKRSKGEESKISLEVVKEMLRDILDLDIEFEISADNVIFSVQSTEVQFDRLSEGYKSVIIWVCDLVGRMAENQPTVNQLKDFKGVVLVDEIDLHLHPKWKFSVVRKLRNWFPQIQFIITTHSPTVILGSSDDAVFYKLYKEAGVTKISQPISSIKNLMANSVLTSPLFNIVQATAAHHDENIDTSDDYLYSVIHKEIAKRVSDDNSLTEDDILSLVQAEMDKAEGEDDQD